MNCLVHQSQVGDRCFRFQNREVLCCRRVPVGESVTGVFVAAGQDGAVEEVSGVLLGEKMAVVHTICPSHRLSVSSIRTYL